MPLVLGLRKANWSAAKRSYNLGSAFLASPNKYAVDLQGRYSQPLPSCFRVLSLGGQTGKGKHTEVGRSPARGRASRDQPATGRSGPRSSAAPAAGGRSRPCRARAGHGWRRRRAGRTPGRCSSGRPRSSSPPAAPCRAAASRAQPRADARSKSSAQGPRRRPGELRQGRHARDAGRVLAGSTRKSPFPEWSAYATPRTAVLSITLLRVLWVARAPREGRGSARAQEQRRAGSGEKGFLRPLLLCWSFLTSKLPNCIFFPVTDVLHCQWDELLEPSWQSMTSCRL